MKKKMLWLLAAVAVVLVLFWDTILLYAAPKTVLTGALTKLYGQLEERFTGSPLAVLAQSYDPEGCYTAQLQAVTENTLLGEIRYDMTVQTDGVGHRLYAEGTAETADKNLDLSLYLDGDFLAVSSADLLKGAWYGITYDSFSSDIRSIPLLQYVLSDALVSRWDDSLQSIRDQVMKFHTSSVSPELSEEDMRALLAGLLLLPGQVSNDQLRLNGVWTDCRRIDYTADGTQLPELLAEKESVSVSFYLCEKTVVQIDFFYTSGEDQLSGGAFFGLDAASETLALQLNQTSLSVRTEEGEGEYGETWAIEKDGTMTEITYHWNADSGDTTLSVNGSAPAALNLPRTENGFRIHTEDCEALLNMTRQEGASTNAPKRCTVTVQKGSDVVTPQYKNLDQWSMEDFWVLLSGVGSLFGIDAS